MKLRYITIPIGIFVLVLIVGTGVLAVRGGPARDRATQLDRTLRTIVVMTQVDQRPALQPGDIAVDLEQGSFPQGFTRATVLTDTDCAADAQGVSHCRNELQVGQRTFAIRHHHRMMEEPCFSPGERLNVLDVASYVALAAAQ